MSERRPHWDDYLLASVMIHCNDIYQCHAVIAAVEDWVYDNFQGGEYDNPVEYTPEELAIQRVRALPERQIVGSDGHVRDMLLRADVLRALDGDA